MVVQLSRKAPLINSISMQTHRRFSFWSIQAEGTNTHTYTCAHRPNNASSIEKRRETLYLPTSFDPSPSPSLFTLILSHILPLPGFSDECVSVFGSLLQGYTHPSVCRCYSSLWIWLSVTVRVCMWHQKVFVSVCVGDRLLNTEEQKMSTCIK